MKKLILSAIALVAAFNLNAGTLTVTLNGASTSNFLSAPFLLTDVVLTSATATNTAIILYDAPTTTVTNVVGAYTNIIQYGSNYVTTYTNFFGRTNNLTNLVLITATNNVAQTTNTYARKLTVNSPASETTPVSGLYYFVNGLTVTNSSQGQATITFTYEK